MARSYILAYDSGTKTTVPVETGLVSIREKGRKLLAVEILEDRLHNRFRTIKIVPPFRRPFSWLMTFLAGAKNCSLAPRAVFVAEETSSFTICVDILGGRHK